MNDHIKMTNEEHLRKTWSNLLKTTERLDELEAVKESMKRLLDGNSEEISELKLSAKKLEEENMTLKNDLVALQKQLEEVRSLKAEYKALKKDVKELRTGAGKIWRKPANSKLLRFSSYPITFHSEKS